MAPTSRALKFLAPCLLVLAAAGGDESCADDKACAADDDAVGLLQVGLAPELVQASVVAAAPRRTIIDLRSPFKPGVGVGVGSSSKCPGEISVTASDVEIPNGATLKYEIDSDGGSCHGTTGYGPSTCCAKWGSDVNFDVSLTTTKVPDSTWKVTVKAAVKAEIFFSYHHVGDVDLECPLCGATCKTPEIHLAGVVTIASTTIEMPDCPTSTSFQGAYTAQLPDEKDIPVNAMVTGTAHIKNPQGQDVASLDLSVELQKP